MKRQKTFAIVAAAVAVLAMASLYAWQNDMPLEFVVAVVGPPPITMREAFADRPDRGVQFDHSDFDALLRAHVDADGFVDYERLRTAAAELDAYLARIGTADLDSLARDELLALLINAYNACTLRLVLDHWPLASINDIPADRRWDGRTFRVGGRDLSLGQLEGEWLRARFVEPRIHFAINCASVGCPPLRAEAYTGVKIEQQLADQSARIHAAGGTRWFRLDAETLWLTQIYLWYRGDFEQVAGRAEAFALAASGRSTSTEHRADARWLDYDWSLNAAR